ncbi:hypothetical protein PUN28_003092 [Cardiocondyla obscurior]|uniref:Uncharacterized protein n=1 Tax=Cardiocondyla obscurior TaxID=286306 RepID=A0AAW2GK43_9HYME
MDVHAPLFARPRYVNSIRGALVFYDPATLRNRNDANSDGIIRFSATFYYGDPRRCRSSAKNKPALRASCIMQGILAILTVPMPNSVKPSDPG